VTLNDVCTIDEIAEALDLSHSGAWRFARSTLGDGIRFGNRRLYDRASANRAIAARRNAR
jgi:hypothetical protein